MEKTVRLTTAQAIVKFLNHQYLSYDGKESLFVEGIFDIFGHGNVLGIGQALEQNPGHLTVIQGKNEQGMAFAAVGFAKQSLRKKIYAVTTSVGPGAANLVTAAGTALANNIPVLLLPGDTFASHQPDPVLQQIEVPHSQLTTTNDALKPVSRYWDRISRPEQVMSSLIKGFDVLTDSENTGPVTICLPQDVASEAYDYPLSFFNKRVHYLNRHLPTERELTELLVAIETSKRPVIIVGGGAKYSGACEELIALSEKRHLPLVETQAGKGLVPASFKNNFGGVGVTGNLAANRLVEHADLIIGVGTRYTDFTTASKSLSQSPNARVINLTISRSQSYKLDGFQVIGDAKLTLNELVTRLSVLEHEPIEMAKLRKEWQTERNRLATITFDDTSFSPEVGPHFTHETLLDYSNVLKTKLCQTTALLKVNDVLPSNSIVVAAAGSLPGDMHRLWQTNSPNGYHLEYGYSCMGYEIGAAFGAKLASPERPVYAFVGDGSFLMLHTELVTSLQYHKKIIILLFDNSGFGCINNLQMSNGSPSFETEFRDSETDVIMTVDYQKIAEGYGAASYSATTLDELTTALNQAEKETKSTLIHIKVLPKTMSDGYDAWWHVGVSAVSDSPTIQNAYATHLKEKEKARYY